LGDFVAEEASATPQSEWIVANSHQARQAFGPLLCESIPVVQAFSGERSTEG